MSPSPARPPQGAGPQAPAAQPEILIEQRGAVLWLSLNRPEVLNALTGTMLSSLMAELKKAEKSPAIRCVVLTG